MRQISTAMDRKSMSSLQLLQAIDIDKSGDVDGDEFRCGIKAQLGLDVSDDHLDLLFKQFDADGSKRIDSAEFISKVCQCMHQMHACMSLMQAPHTHQCRHQMAQIRGEPDLQTAMETIVDWMDQSKHTMQTFVALLDQDGDGSKTHMHAHMHARQPSD